jgi:hypothetical protein
MAVALKCPVHGVEMRLTKRELPKEHMYYLCPKWGCVQRYREQEGYFTTAKLPTRSGTTSTDSLDRDEK